MYRGGMSALNNPLELAALATAVVPGLRVAGLRPPQFRDDVVSVTGMIDTDGNRWTVVAPHDQVGGLDMEIQSAVLSRLSHAHENGALSFAVPKPAGFIRTKQGLRAMVYPETGGDFATAEDFMTHSIFAASLATALATLHNLPPTVFTELDLASYSATECRERHLAILEEARQHTVVPSNLWDRWKNALDTPLLWRFAPTPVHGDMQLTSVQLNHGCVQLISGFSSAHVGDPAQDVAWIRALAPDQFLRHFYQAYAHQRSATDLHLMTRAQLLSELAVVRWLVHGVHVADYEIIHNAQAMLIQISQELGHQQLVETLDEQEGEDTQSISPEENGDPNRRLDHHPTQTEESDPFASPEALKETEREELTGALNSCDMPTECLPAQ